MNWKVAFRRCHRVPLDCNKLFGPRDESLVVTDRIENVPEELVKWACRSDGK